MKLLRILHSAWDEAPCSLILYCFLSFSGFRGCECVAFAPSINILAVWAQDFDFNPRPPDFCSFCDL